MSDGTSVNSLRLVTKQPTPQMENESTAVKVHHTIGHQDGVGAIREGFPEEVSFKRHIRGYNIPSCRRREKPVV